MEIIINENTSNEDFRKYVSYLQGELDKKNGLISSFETKEKTLNDTINDKDKTINDLKVKNYDLFMQIPQNISSTTSSKVSENVVGKKSIEDVTNKLEV